MRNGSGVRVLFVSALLFIFCGSMPGQGKEAPLFKVGVEYRSISVDKPYNWRDAKTHALMASIWYPAAPDSDEQPQLMGPADRQLFELGRAATKATLASSPAKFPLIVLSHGTGGSALQMVWLGSFLAAHGYIAAAVNHPGNNAVEAYTAQGFSTWWERARDLSTLIDSLLADSTFGSRIDPGRIGAAGFSLGGYTMIEIAGGITERAAFTEFCKSPRADDICKSPPEFPQLFEDFDRLSKTDPDFQTALRHASDSFRDPRVRAVFAIAPALGPAFRPASLARIAIPVEIVAGANDTNVPIASSAQYFAANISKAKLTVFPGKVGHYVFLDTCTDRGKNSLPMLCQDAPGVDRNAIHAKTATLALQFFAGNLK
ncbi:MAG: peptidase [Acidobacteriia bacterium]|nr:peptidase [Terriglobia bacterium]